MIDNLNKFYCGVTFKDRTDFINKVKQVSQNLGTKLIAEFDKENKCWCIVNKSQININSKDLVLIAKYLPKPIDYNKNFEYGLDVEQFFLKNLSANGYEVSRLEVCKDANNWKRCKVSGDKGKEKSGGYVFLTDHTGFKVLLFKSFRSSANTTHKLTTKDFIQTEKNVDFKKQSQQDHLCNLAYQLNKSALNKIKQEKEAQKRRVALQQLLKSSQEILTETYTLDIGILSSLNSYIIQKNIESSDKIFITMEDIKHPIENYICCPKNSLVIPIFDIKTNELINLQIITPKLEKRFLKGYSTTNGCVLVNNKSDFSFLNENSPIILCEGFATAYTVYSHLTEIIPNLTHMPYVYACLNCSGMVNIAKVLVNEFKINQLIVCADNDHETEQKIGKNPGLEAFKEIKAFAKDSVVYYPPAIKGCSDWNDFYNLQS